MSVDTNGLRKLAERVKACKDGEPVMLSHETVAAVANEIDDLRRSFDEANKVAMFHQTTADFEAGNYFGYLAAKERIDDLEAKLVKSEAERMKAERDAKNERDLKEQYRADYFKANDQRYAAETKLEGAEARLKAISYPMSLMKGACGHHYETEGDWARSCPICVEIAEIRDSLMGRIAGFLPGSVEQKLECETPAGREIPGLYDGMQNA